MTHTVPDLPIDPPEPDTRPGIFDRADAAYEAHVDEQLQRAAECRMFEAPAGWNIGRMLDSCLGVVRAGLKPAVAGTGVTLRIKAGYEAGAGDRVFDGGNAPRVVIRVEGDEIGSFTETVYRDPRSPEFLAGLDATVEKLARDVGRKARFIAFEREHHDAERWDGMS